MSKKKIIEISGKEEGMEPTTLEQIFGYNQMARYNTMDASLYSQSLDEMNRTDLEAEARRVGALIVEETPRLRANLEKEFTAYVSSLQKPKNFNRPISLSKEAEKILKEGR